MQSETVSPPRNEVLLMCFPEVFGRSDGGKFTVTSAE